MFNQARLKVEEMLFADDGAVASPTESGLQGQMHGLSLV